MKILFLQEYVRENHISNKNGKPTVNYKATEAGKKLTELVKTIGLTARDYAIDYDFDRIPNPQKVDNKTGKVIKYKEPVPAERLEPEARLKQRLLGLRPDVIIPMGNMGCRNLLGVASITKLRGVPTKVEISEDYVPWVLPMFSMEYLTMNPNLENLVTADIQTLGRFLEQGEEAFKPRSVNYELVMSLDRVKQIFDFLYKVKPLTSWDLETNTLHAELIGAKPLVMTLSWEEGQGVTIPLEHHESPFNEEELDVIYGLAKRFLADAEQIKVGHNLQFDTRFLMGAKGFTEFQNNRDTLIAYYLVVVQKIEASKRLSDLAFELTDMGGYDAPLEQFKKDYKEKYVREKTEEIAKAKAEAKEKIESEYKIATAEYKKAVQEAKELGKSRKGIIVPKKGKMPKFPTKSTIKPVNEIDGSDFNYDWIPLEILHPYASGDTDCCLRIHNELERRIKPNNKMYTLWTEFYPKLTRALAHIEATGVMVDEDYAKVLVEEYTKEEQRLLEEIRKIPVVQELEEEHMELYQVGLAEWAKPPKERDKELAKLRDKYKVSDKENKVMFNPSSSIHKGKVLYKKLGISLPYDKESVKATPFDAGIPENQLTWEDYKTDKHALAFISEHYPEHKGLADILLEYSKVNTLKNNFAVKLPNMVSNKDFKVHGSFKITGTECVAGDTLILTDDGLREIQSLSKNREVKSFSPSEAKAYSKDNELEDTLFYYSGVSDGLKIVLADGTKLVTTPNHPLMKNMRYTKKSQKNRTNKKFVENMQNNDWELACELKAGDYLVAQVGTERYGNKTQLPEVPSEVVERKTTSKEIILPRELTPELAEWLGMYMADGSFSTASGSFSIMVTNNDIEVRDRFTQLTNRLFNLDTLDRAIGAKASYVQVSSIVLGRWLTYLFDIKPRALKKDVPTLILQSTKEVQQGFIRGLTLDSSTEKRKYPALVLSSISEPLMQKVKLMLANMGIFGRISIAKDKRSYAHDLNQLYLTFENLDKFMSEIGFVESVKETRMRDKLTSYTPTRATKTQGVVQGGGVTLVEVKSVTPVNSVEFFDLNMSATHSFIGNGIINHNTSRLSSKDPNMQQVPSKVGDPRRFDYTYPIKRMFRTSFKNGVLLQLDYSALEMRILALVAQDMAMTQAFFDGEDLHKATASLLYGKPVEEITADERQSAKSVNFGLAYGETPFSFAPKQGITVQEAEELFDKYFASKPRIKEFIDETHKFASTHGYVDTLQGHRRMLRDAFAKERNTYNGAMRKSVNTIIQGTGAYLTNMSLVYIDDYLREKNMKSRIVLTVHDSIVIDCPSEEADEVAKVSNYIMENLPIDFLFIEWEGKTTRFPIKADCEIGRNYNDMIDYDPEVISEFESLDGCIKYQKDQKKIKDHMAKELISKEQGEQILAQIKASKIAYQQMK